MQQYLVFDIGGTFIKYAHMREDGSMLAKGSIPSPVDDLENLYAALQQIAQPFAGQYAGVPISMPGRIDTARGIAHTGGAFDYIHDVPFAAELSRRLDVPVTVANDGKCAANAEAWSGALSTVDNGCVLVLGTGIGGGIVLNGKVWMGNTFAAGELSSLPSNFDALYGGIASPWQPGVHSVWCSDVSSTGLLRNYALRKGLPEQGHGLDGFAFFAAWEAGEPEAHETLAEFGRRAAAGIYAVQSVLDLQRYAIGGGISARPEVLQSIRAGLDALFAAIPYTPFAKPEVVACRYGNDANLLGALRFHIIH